MDTSLYAVAGAVIILITLLAAFCFATHHHHQRQANSDQLLREIGRWLKWMLQPSGKAELNQAHVWVKGTKSDNTLRMLEYCRRVWDALENPRSLPVTLVVKLGEPCPHLTNEQVQKHPAVKAQLHELCLRLGLGGEVTCEVIQQRSPDATLLELTLPTPPRGLRLVANRDDQLAEAG